MKQLIIVILIVLWSNSVFAKEANFNGQKFATAYFNAWKATQLPNATEASIDKYLKFFKDDLGHQHIPYDVDDSRSADAKQSMKKGMMFYLGVHSEYNAEIRKVITGDNVVVIKYFTHAKGKHPQTGQEMVMDYDTVEVLELEDGLISVIRKYSE